MPRQRNTKHHLIPKSQGRFAIRIEDRHRTVIHEPTRPRLTNLFKYETTHRVHDKHDGNLLRLAHPGTGKNKRTLPILRSFAASSLLYFISNSKDFAKSVIPDMSFGPDERNWAL